MGEPELKKAGTHIVLDMPALICFEKPEAPHVTIKIKVATKEMLGSEIIYSLNSVYGTLMAKTDYDVSEGADAEIYVPLKSMYLFDKDERRIETDLKEIEMIRKAFEK